MPEKGTYRYTVETLESGQPRAYADTISHIRVTFEYVPWIGPNEGFKPWELREELIRERLNGLGCGFTEFVCPKNPTMDQHFTTRLDWLRNPEPGVWEFHTTSPYTD